jgi:bacterioferritin
MRGNDKVLEQLNKGLSSELTAIVQYMTQSEMCANWGYVRLAGLHKTRAIEEMKHAETLIERIIFLDGLPVVEVGLKPRLGTNYNVAVQVCVDAKDDGSRQLFENLIKDEERHVDFLEAQLHSLGEVGIANYLAQQIQGA